MTCELHDLTLHYCDECLRGVADPLNEVIATYGQRINRLEEVLATCRTVSEMRAKELLELRNKEAMWIYKTT